MASAAHAALTVSPELKVVVGLAVTRDEIVGAMRRARGLRPGQEDNFAINEQSAITNMYREVTSGVFAGGIGIAAIALLVGGIGIMNIMLASVLERTREIGIRSALGARRTDIRNLFLIESFSISLAGGLTGVLVGIGVARLVAAGAAAGAAATTHQSRRQRRAGGRPRTRARVRWLGHRPDGRERDRPG